MTAPAWQQYGLEGMNGGQGLVVLRCPTCSALVPKTDAAAHEEWHVGLAGDGQPDVATALTIARGHLEADDACTTSDRLARAIIEALEP